MVIGVLALQGAVREHLWMIEKCRVQAEPIKKPAELLGIDGLIIPGGESTTLGSLMVEYDFVRSVQDLYRQGLPIYGTCAGLILLAKRVIDGSQPLLRLMDIEVRRNAFGRQRESFEADLEIPELGKKPFHGVFIRAPWIESVGPGVEVMARFDDKIVMAREDNLLATAFHPELTKDTRIHKYFIEMVK